MPDLMPSAGQVLVRVRASGLNRGEIGQVKSLRTGSPSPIGVEFAGEVATVGADVSTWHEGDRVMGHGRGGQAEYALADPRALMRVPPNLSWTEAASFPNVFITGHDAVVTNGQLRTGEAILVNAASSGIGLAAIQIASLLKPSRSSPRAVQLPRSRNSRSMESMSQLTRVAVHRSTLSWPRRLTKAWTSSSTASAARSSRPILRASPSRDDWSTSPGSDPAQRNSTCLSCG